MHTLELKSLLGKIKYKNPEKEGFVLTNNNGKTFLQFSRVEVDPDDGVTKTHKGRKWYISPYATKSEIVQTAFKAILTFEEHEAREFFTYKGKKIFGPHYDVEKLVELCDSGEAEEVREENGA